MEKKYGMLKFFDKIIGYTKASSTSCTSTTSDNNKPSTEKNSSYLAYFIGFKPQQKASKAYEAIVTFLGLPAINCTK